MVKAAPPVTDLILKLSEYSCKTMSAPSQPMADTESLAPGPGQGSTDTSVRPVSSDWRASHFRPARNGADPANVPGSPGVRERLWRVERRWRTGRSAASPVIDEAHLSRVEPVSATRDRMAAESKREPDRHADGEEFQPQAEIDAGSNICRCRLLIHDQHASLTLLIETGGFLHVQSHADLPIHSHYRAPCAPAYKRRDSPSLTGVLERTGKAGNVGRQIL